MTEHFDRFVEDSVDSGRYHNASEVVREGLRLLETKEQVERLKLECLREASAAGFAAIDRGEFRAVEADQIGDFVAGLGTRVSRRKHARKI